MSYPEAEILRAWEGNAEPWTRAVRDGCIESRQLVTDGAIVDAILARSPRTLLDVGCGEGWLARELAGRGIGVTAVDAVPALVNAARQLGGGDFRVARYDQLADCLAGVRFDAVVCNFSLLGEQSVAAVFRAVPALLSDNGVFIIQTLHPLFAAGQGAYRDGWRQGSWAGIDGDFRAPAPWYFRTLESWRALFPAFELVLEEILEPRHPRSGQPVSVIFVAMAR